MLGAAALPHRTKQFAGMTDPQIFAFLVMPILLIMTCSMMFFSSRNIKPGDPQIHPCL
jgi:hypothetical protein